MKHKVIYSTWDSETPSILHKTALCGEQWKQQNTADSSTMDSSETTCPKCLKIIAKHTCPRCGKYFTNHEPEAFIKPQGMCKVCYVKSKGLVKVNNHYVPWDYVFHTISGQPRNTDYVQDANAELPKISWCDEHKKYEVEFTGADCGGRDTRSFVWYFDTVADIMEEMDIPIEAPPHQAAKMVIEHTTPTGDLQIGSGNPIMEPVSEFTTWRGDLLALVLEGACLKGKVKPGDEIIIKIKMADSEV